MVEKNEKLFVVVLGEQHSGKTYTWKALFELKDMKRIVRQGKKMLTLSSYLKTDVYIFPRSFQELNLTKEDFIKKFEKAEKVSNIILCSLQTILPNKRKPDVIDSKKMLEIIADKKYDIYIQWLYPGIKSKNKVIDYEKTKERIIELMRINSVIGIGNVDAEKVNYDERAEKLRAIIFGWILSR